MIVVYPFSINDEGLALKNASWIAELGGCPGHEVLLIGEERCKNVGPMVENELKRSFDKVHRLITPAIVNGWPQGANFMFRLATAWMLDKSYPFFMWMEPDAIPLKEGWLDAIAAEYARGGRPFMGDRVQVENIPLHMSGVGIYPNPLHQYSGEAYRAHEVAWDMAGKDQIVPQAYFTKLIEHAWKHPSFREVTELTTQIRPEAVLFHSSKDGSLIDLLKSKQGRKQLDAAITGGSQSSAHPKDTDEPVSPSLITLPGEAASGQQPTESTATTVPRTGGTPSLEEIGDRAAQPHPETLPTCDIFIRTYPGDYEWLFNWCLRSIFKFCYGFRKVIVVSPAPLEEVWKPQLEKWDVTWKVLNEEAEDHYLSQQIHKLYADVITDYQADYILHVDSDVIFTKSCDPEFFLGITDKKVVWPYTPYSEISTPWQPITEKFMDDKVEHEFMRRFPIMIPRWLYPRVREFCHKQHGMIISEYIRLQPLRAFSEFNALGAYAYKYHRDKFHFVNTVEHPLPEPLARQFHSWSGITPEVKTELDKIFSAVPVLAEPRIRSLDQNDSGEARESNRRTPHVAAENRTAETHEDSRGGREVPPGIKELSGGLWILKDDTHIGTWIEQQQRLDHDQNLLPFILPYIHDGDTVVDAGAFVGDHTIAYLKKVGKTGVVHAIEPNPLAMKCLKHNLSLDRNGDYSGHGYDLCTYELALGDKFQNDLPLSGNNNNFGGSYLGEHMPIAKVRMLPLDELNLSPDFIKFDIEGCEVKALKGAEKTITIHHPILVLEVNYEALRRQNNRVGEIFAILENWDYDWKILQENCCLTSPMYDILCTHKTSPEEPIPAQHRKGVEVRRCSPTPPPVTPLYDMMQAILFLKEFASRDSNHRLRVMKNLSANGLTPRWPARKKKKK